MKRFLTFLMAAALMLGAGAMTSCGGDDEQKAGTQLSGTAASLVGTWRTEANYGYYDMITLNADGTGVWREVDLESGSDEFDAFRWSYEEMTRRLILTYGGGYNIETEVYEVISISGNSAILGHWDEDQMFYVEVYRVQ